MAQPRTITVTGIVRDAASGLPISAVTVVFDTTAVAVTNEEGRYRTQEIEARGGTISLFYRRLGYASSGSDVLVPDSATEVRADITLLPAPTDVERIVVQGERMAIANPGLVGFYERREEGFGRYLTGEEIGRIGGMDLQNHLRRLRVRALPRDQRDPFARPEFSSCIAAFVDGVRLLDVTTINEWVPASSLGGIEFHRPNELSHLPAEFVPPPPPGCRAIAGVIMFWSKVQRDPSPFEIGVVASSLYGGDAGRARYVGGKFVTPVRSRIRTLSLHINVDARIAGDGALWRALFNLGFRPFGRGTPLYTGTGFGVKKEEPAGSGAPGESIAAVHTVMVGLSVDVARFRPFVEAQVLDLIGPRRVGVVSMVGVRFLYVP